jgi:hypothetical protein
MTGSWAIGADYINQAQGQVRPHAIESHMLGDPGTAGTVPVVIEMVLPILLFALLPFVSKNRRD